MTREFTNLLLERVHDGIYDKDLIINAFCSFMSEDEVKDMMIINELLEDELLNDDSEEVEND